MLACLAVVLGFGIRHLYLMISVGAFNPTYVDNIAIYGVSLAGCDREEGKALILALEEEWKNEVYTFSYRNQSWNFSRSMVDADMECESRLEQAWNLGHIGSLSERKRQIDALARNPQNLMPTLSYDEQKLDAFVDEICAAIDVEPVDAVVVPDVNQPLVISESSTGLRVDREQLKTQLVTLIQTGQSDTALPVDTLFPNVSSDQLSFQQIAYCQTDTTFRNSASRSNVRLALNAFNGLVVQPGESCDFNEIVGPRTEKRGFQKAIEFAGDETVEGIGGGVCQASTTLYNALVQADMTILERRQHGMTVSYAEPSLDAAVSENGKNLIFKNETDYPIYIYTSVDSEWAKVTIYGHRPDYRYVLENVITEENIPSTRKIAEPDYSGTYVYFTDDPPVLQSEGKPGCRSQGWVVAYDWDTGEEVSRVHVSTDNYNPGVSTYWIGTHDRATEFAGVGTNPNY